MGKIKFTPKWKEELIGTCEDYSFTIEVTMGEFTAYFPSEQKWKETVPEWAQGERKTILEELKLWGKENNVPVATDDSAWIYFEKEKKNS